MLLLSVDVSADLNTDLCAGFNAELASATLYTVHPVKLARVSPGTEACKRGCRESAGYFWAWYMALISDLE